MLFRSVSQSRYEIAFRNTRQYTNTESRKSCIRSFTVPNLLSGNRHTGLRRHRQFIWLARLDLRPLLRRRLRSRCPRRRKYPLLQRIRRLLLPQPLLLPPLLPPLLLPLFTPILAICFLSFSTCKELVTSACAIACLVFSISSNNF